MKKKPTKPRSTKRKNGVAKALRTPKYKMQVVPDKRMKDIEARLKKLEHLIWQGPMGRDVW